MQKQKCFSELLWIILVYILLFYGKLLFGRLNKNETLPTVMYNLKSHHYPSEWMGGAVCVYACVYASV